MLPKFHRKNSTLKSPKILKKLLNFAIKKRKITIKVEDVAECSSLEARSNNVGSSEKQWLEKKSRALYILYKLI